jgi:hypothetical protein
MVAERHGEGVEGGRNESGGVRIFRKR